MSTTTVPTQINLVPAMVQIRSAIGASVGLRLRATHGDGTAFDLTPYAVEAPIKAEGAEPPVPAWAVVVEDGTAILLNLSSADTTTLGPGGRAIMWHWDVWLTNTLAPERLLFAHGELGSV